MDGLNFLGELFSQGLSYSSINTARSALSALFACGEGAQFGNNNMVTRFMKGVYCVRSSLPRYKETWDISRVLNHIRSWHPLSQLNLKKLTLKTVSLMAIISMQRSQTLQALEIGENLTMGSEECTFMIKSLLKTSKPNHHLGYVTFKAYPDDHALCVLSCIREYIKRTEALRGENNRLFISFVKPHRQVSTETIRRWLKATLELCGIDTTKFKAHSFRAAATSAASQANVPIEIILKTANWNNAKTFRKFYEKTIVTA